MQSISSFDQRRCAGMLLWYALLLHITSAVCDVLLGCGQHSC